MVTTFRWCLIRGGTSDMVAERLHKDKGGTHKKRHCEPMQGDDEWSIIYNGDSGGMTSCKATDDLSTKVQNQFLLGSPSPWRRSGIPRLVGLRRSHRS